MIDSFNEALIGITIFSLIGSAVLVAYIIHYKKTHNKTKTSH